MSSRTTGFAVAEEDLERLGRLAEKFGRGNRSAFLREAMRQMETVERAERLAGGRSPEDALDRVRRVLQQRL